MGAPTAGAGGGRKDVLDDEKTGLDIGEDVEFERREWKVERIAWLVMLLVVLAAAAGLFGNGLFSRTTSASEDGRLEVAFQRFARSGGRTTIEVSVAPGTAVDGELRILISRDYLSRFEVRQVTPEPESSEPAGDSIAYSFKVSDGRSPVEVHFVVEAGSAGRFRGTVAAGDGARVRFSQFVYP